MTISTTAFAALIVVALGLVLLAPLVLVLLLVRDWRNGDLW